MAAEPSSNRNDRVNPSTRALGAVLALTLAACSQPSQESASDREFGQRVRAYLLAHPEVLEEATQALQVKRQKEQMAAAKAAITKYRDQVERDPRDFVANPNGRITVTEFYDYNCGYCKLVAPEMVALIRENPDVRFVFKEFVIFGPLSDRAAHAALLSKKNGRYVQVHSALMAEKPLTEAAIDRILRQNGLDPALLNDARALQPHLKHVADTGALAQRLGLEGTPAFIVGETLIPGADVPALKAAIAAAKRGS